MKFLMLNLFKQIFYAYFEFTKIALTSFISTLTFIFGGFKILIYADLWIN